MTDGYQKFYEKWDDKSSRSKFLETKFPYELSLGAHEPPPGADSKGVPLLPFRNEIMSGDKILVTKSYDDMFHRLVRLRNEYEGRGAVITGQPGIGGSPTRSSPHTMTHRPAHSPGKTTFLIFMLARLISAHQVVLLCGNAKIHLFYRGQVYYQPAESDFTLPRSLYDHPIWSLIDVDFKDREPPESITGIRSVWPIQTSSPNPVRWKYWSKQAEAAILGMPLWTMEELVKGYVFNLFPLPVTCRSIGRRLTLAFTTVYVIDAGTTPFEAN